MGRKRSLLLHCTSKGEHKVFAHQIALAFTFWKSSALYNSLRSRHEAEQEKDISVKQNNEESEGLQSWTKIHYIFNSRNVAVLHCRLCLQLRISALTGNGRIVASHGLPIGPSKEYNPT
ncbi:Hypothetical predicted protein [Podarcis lilfordi]|uniref:Uncharacterized protein n=1 Tax=Podarcis lilfordi TaxID=74358 RepID=A0AA35K6R7_9SAUR|nr:Hypothetical predicted protein [Podarcis lilfordi]